MNTACPLLKRCKHGQIQDLPTLVGYMNTSVEESRLLLLCYLAVDACYLAVDVSPSGFSFFYAFSPLVIFHSEALPARQERAVTTDPDCRRELNHCLVDSSPISASCR